MIQKKGIIVSKWDDFKETIAIVGLGIFAVLGFAYVGTFNAKEKTKQMQMEIDYPPEYWVAKQAEIEHDIRKHEIDISSKERLAMDKRDREDMARRERIAFEQNAPDGYWESKKVAEQEKTRREMNRQQVEMNKRQLEANKYIARQMF